MARHGYIGAPIHLILDPVSSNWPWPNTSAVPTATLFHLGVFDAPPIKLSNASARMHAARRSQQWDGVAPVVAITLRKYLDQIALTLRPSTVKRAEAILREFACFLAISAPDVSRIADVRRSSRLAEIRPSVVRTLCSTSLATAAVLESTTPLLADDIILRSGDITRCSRQPQASLHC